MINYYKILIENPYYFKQFSCKDLLFLKYDCPIKEKKVATWSRHNYLFYVVKGKKIFHTPERSWTLTGGKAVFVKKGACILEQFFHEPSCIFVFVLPDSFIRQFMQEHGSIIRKQISPPGPELLIEIEADSSLRDFYQSVLPFFGSVQNPPEEMIELKFYELLLQILSDPQNRRLTDYLRSVASQKNLSVDDVMETNYPFNLSLSDYAALCNRSLSSFKRDFRSVYHISPGKWLLGKKLNRACLLLSSTDKPVADVAMESGFENTAHFSRVFRKKYGKAPVHFRRITEVRG